MFSTRRLIVACVFALMALIAAGCGGSGDDGPDLTTDLTAAQLLTQSAAKAKAAASYRVDFTGVVGVKTARGAQVPGVGLALDEPIRFSGAGPAAKPDRFAVDATATISGLPAQGNLTRIGDDLFLSVFGRDFRLAVPAAQVRRLDAFDAIPTLAGWIAQPEKAGDEEIDGTATTKVTGTVDPAAAVADLAPLLSTIGGISADDVRRTAAGLDASGSDSTVTVWIGTADLLPRRIDARMTVTDGQRLSPAQSLTFEVSVRLSDFGAPVEIQPPTDPSPLSFDDLTGFLR